MRPVISGLGMVSTLGRDAVTACAALRAGMTRPRPLAFYVPSSEDLLVEPVFGHPMTGTTDGFEGLGLYLLLAHLALSDLLDATGCEPGNATFWKESGLWVCTSTGRLDDEYELEAHERMLDKRLVPELIRYVGLVIPMKQTRRVPLGHASVLFGVQEACDAIRGGRLARALVVGVDSLVDEGSLEWLASRNRLKTPEHAVGVMPGEAAAALLLERADLAERRKAKILAEVSDIATGYGEKELPEAAPSAGMALSRVIEQVVARAGSIGSVYGDLNGEDARAREWGLVLVRNHKRLGGVRLWLPATSFGDTGAASGAIGLVAACRSFERKYAGGDEVLVCARGDFGEVAAGVVRRP